MIILPSSCVKLILETPTQAQPIALRTSFLAVATIRVAGPRLLPTGNQHLSRAIATAPSSKALLQIIRSSLHNIDALSRSCRRFSLQTRKLDQGNGDDRSSSSPLLSQDNGADLVRDIQSTPFRVARAGRRWSAFAANRWSRNWPA
jgi:hypothetical protein